MHEDDRLLPFEIQRQPDDETCGATCLHAIYRYFGTRLPFADLLRDIPTLRDGGTLGVLLATHALAQGFRATIVTWNLEVFDPTWFALTREALQTKLAARARTKQNPKLSYAARAYAEFLARGGKVEFRDLEPKLFREYLERRVPILTGLSATFLYREPRERPSDGEPDDIAGDPVGHFAVLTGYKSKTQELLVSDPMHPNPLSVQHTYPVPIERVIGAVYLGVLTYDANLVIIEPRA